MLSPRQTAALNLIDEGEEYAAYFFKRAKGLHWFDELRSRGHFSADRNPAPRESEKGFYTIPNWPALEYLEKVSQLCVTAENRRFADALMEIIRSVTRPTTGSRVDNYRTWWSFAKILANLPNDIISVSDIDLMQDWLLSSFDTSLVGIEIGKLLEPKFLASTDPLDWKKAARIVDIVTKVTFTPKASSDQTRTVVQTYWLRSLLRRNAAALGEKCGPEVANIVIDRLKQVVPPRDDKYSYVWRPTIEDDRDGIYEDDARHVFLAALRDILMSYTKSTAPKQAISLLTTITTHSLNIVRRIALYVLSQHYANFHKLAWRFVQAALFEDNNFRHELYLLLHLRFREFRPAQQRKLIEIIESLPSHAPREDTERFSASTRIIWLHAIRDQGHPVADRLFEQYRNSLGGVPERPDLTSYVESGFFADTAPLSTEQLLALDTSALVQYLRDFRASTGWRQPSVRGLADVLEAAVKQQPDRFQQDLSAFLSVGSAYLQAILSGLHEVWGKRHPVDWKRILEFCLAIVTTPAFWEEASTDDSMLTPRREWVTTEMSRLIRSGMSDDNWAFDESLLPDAERIIVRLLAKEPSTATGGGTDALTEAINTPRGTCVEALLSYALRRARLADLHTQAHVTTWQELQPLFEGELSRCQDSNYEFSALAGAYLPSLSFLSPTWVENNVDRIFSTDSPTNWRCAIEGFAYVTGFHDSLYALLRDHGHLLRALQSQFANRQVREKILQFATVAYLRSLDPLEGNRGILSGVIEHFDETDLSHVVWFLWTLRREKLPPTMVEAINKFWRLCSNRLRGDESRYGRLLSNLVLLAAFLDRITDQTKDLLLQAAPYADESHHSSLFLEELARLAQVSPADVGEVFLVLLTRTLPTYDPKDVREIVAALYRNGNRDTANRIADLYARKQFDLLKDLYDQNNRAQ